MCSVIRGRNKLAIERIHHIVDRNRDLLILMIESQHILNNEIHVFLKDHILVIKTPLKLEIEKPVRSHLVEKESLNEFEKDVKEIIFSEIRLNHKYSYGMITYSMVRPGLLKVILNCKKGES